MHRDALFAFFAAVFLSVFAAPAFADYRVALVIGNGAYTRVPHPPNPVHDAEDVAAALKRSGRYFAERLERRQGSFSSPPRDRI
jgi:hypothetical protein